MIIVFIMGEPWKSPGMDFWTKKASGLRAPSSHLLFLDENGSQNDPMACKMVPKPLYGEARVHQTVKLRYYNYC